jgi:hypothetical protein
MAAVPSASTAVHAPQHKRRDCSTCTMTVHDRVTWPLSRRFYPARPARGTASHTLYWLVVRRPPNLHMLPNAPS